VRPAESLADCRQYARTVVVDCFGPKFTGFRPGFAIVAVDVIRATTMAITAVALGRRCFPADTIDSAVQLAETLTDPLLAGELGGNMPYGFDLDNSPATLVECSDVARPLVLLSTSGTQLICEASRASGATYAACLRNYTAQAAHLLAYHPNVAIIGAASRGEFREEDQLCCAWIAEQLVAGGYEPVGDTLSIVDRWKGAAVEDMLVSNSVRYLRSTGRERDLDFILSHVDDLSSVFAVEGREIVARSGLGGCASPGQTDAGGGNTGRC
jgi:2-phosphosulfolactate phosphatase